MMALLVLESLWLCCKCTPEIALLHILIAKAVRLGLCLGAPSAVCSHLFKNTTLKKASALQHL